MRIELLGCLVLLVGCGGSTTSDGGVSGDVCSNVPASAADAKARSQCGLGTDAPLFLHATPYTHVVIEVAATVGATPRSAALDHLTSVIADVCGKPGASVVMGAMNIAAPGHPLTIDDVRAMEDANRTQFSMGDTAVFFYLVVSDPSSDDTASGKVLGLAHRAASMVVFQSSVDSVSGGLGQPSADIVESTVVAHEFGHVLGLVNAGTPMVTPHQDTAHGAHDSNNQCLMYWANNSSAGIANLIGGGTITDFDANCRADLAAVRSAM